MLDPLAPGVTMFGDTAQDEDAGRGEVKVQLTVTCWLKPPCGVRVTV
jgi:hypothetical protein